MEGVVGTGEGGPGVVGEERPAALVGTDSAVAPGPAAAGPAAMAIDTATAGPGGPEAMETDEVPMFIFGQIAKPAADDIALKNAIQTGLLDTNIASFVSNLHVSKTFTSVTDKIKVLENIIRFLILIRDLEPHTDPWKNYSYISKYIQQKSIVLGSPPIYGLDVRAPEHLENAIILLEEVTGLYSDQGKSTDDLIEAARKLVEEDSTILKGVLVKVDGILGEATTIAAGIKGTFDSLKKKIKDSVNASLIDPLNDVLIGYDPDKAKKATKFLITNSLKITGSIYTVLGIVEYGASAAALAAGFVAGAAPAVLGAAAAITIKGIQLYMYLLNVLVFAPSFSAYSLLYVIFLLHKFNLWSGLGVMVAGHIREKRVRGETEVLRKWETIKEGLLNPTFRELMDFNAFLQENVYTPLGDVTSDVVDQFKQLRVEGLNSKLKEFPGLDEDARGKLIDMLKTPDEETPDKTIPELSLIEMEDLEDPEYIPELTEPNLLYVPDPEPRSIFKVPGDSVSVTDWYGSNLKSHIDPIVREVIKKRKPAAEEPAAEEPGAPGPPGAPEKKRKLGGGKKRKSKKGKKPKSKGRRGKSRKGKSRRKTRKK